MKATIEIEALYVETVIGVYEHEKNQKQALIFNIKLDTDISKAVASDSLSDALDYHDLSLGVVDLVERSRCELIEVLASDVAQWIMERYAPVCLELTISKPNAINAAKSVNLTLSLP